MREVPPDTLIKEAEALAGKEVGWHFHLLLKQCAFNEKRGTYAMVLENEETGETMAARFSNNPAAQAKKMAGLSFGAGFMEKEGGAHEPGFDEMMKMARALDEKKVEWHHHLFPPGCVFNEKEGKYVIMLEDEKGRICSSLEYALNPSGDMAKLEKLFYKDVDR
ncbi:MAG: hypothetical protein V1728_00915 [Candidatus Micrarchaeota archaeon]